ncbi:hypothetical protein AVEN_181239-1, partial [Araneus ventricosus]
SNPHEIRGRNGGRWGRGVLRSQDKRNLPLFADRNCFLNFNFCGDLLVKFRLGAGRSRVRPDSTEDPPHTRIRASYMLNLWTIKRNRS